MKYASVRQITQRLRETNRICAKERASAESAFAFLALKDVDGVEVVCKDEHRPCPSADKLSEDVSGYLSPWEASEDGHAESYLHNIF